MDKNLPARAGDMGLIPGPGSFRMPQAVKAHAPRLLSPQALGPKSPSKQAARPQLLKPAHPRSHTPQLLSRGAATTEALAPRACALQQEKPLQ